jgi:hypothetical protein
MSTAIAIMPQDQGITVSPSYAEMMRPRNLDDALRLAEMLSKSQFVPTTFRGKPGDVLAAIMFGAELGVGPLQALQNVNVINGKPSVWGDLALALCQSHPLYEWHKEWFEQDKDGPVAVFQIKRRNNEVHEVRFGSAQAKEAGLLGKDTYKSYKARMFQMRARGFGLRDKFADALKGLITRDEAEDYPSEPVRAEVITTTSAPQAPNVETPRSAVEATKAKLRAKQQPKEDTAEPNTATVVTLERVLDVIANAKTLNELDRGVAPLAKKLPEGDQQAARDAFRSRKAALQAEAEFANDEPPHGEQTGEVLQDERDLGGET